MANVIDTLVVLLKLDPTQFDAAQKKAVSDFKKTGEAAGKVGSDIEVAGKKGAQFFVGMRNEALRFAAVLVGFKGLTQFTTDTISAGAAQGRLAKNLGQTTAETARLMKAVQLKGGDPVAAGQSMMNLVQSLEELRATGKSDIVPIFNALGVSLKNADGSLRSVTQLYLALGEAVQSHKLDAPSAIYYLQKLGTDQGTINLIIDGMTRYLALADKVGYENEKEADSFIRLEQAATSFWSKIASFGRAGVAFGSDILSDSLDTATDIMTGDFPWAKAAANAKKLAGGTVGGIGSVIDAQKAKADAPESDALLSLFQKLENSGPTSVSPRGAIGRNQIMPGTAAQFGFDPSRLMEPDYNDQVARAIQLSLAKKYNGNLDAMAIAYNAGPGRADAYLKNGQDLLSLPRETQNYVARERQLVGGPGATVTNIGTINVSGDNAKEVARDIRAELAQNNSLVQQANAGPQ